jgi:hypothetical protein
LNKLTIFVLALSFGILGVGCKGDPFGCSKDENGERRLPLQLGQPGTTHVINELPANDSVIVLEEEENIEFTTDAGEATITHNPDRDIQPGDILVANPEQRYLVRVHEVIERSSGSTQAILRQARIADVVGDADGRLHIESTPVYDLEDIERINRLAQINPGDETVYETDSLGRLVIRNLEMFSLDLNSEGQISGGANKILGIPIENPYEKFTVTSGAGGRYRAVINEAIIEIVPTMRSESQWRRGRIEELQTRMDTRVRYRVDITYEAAGQIQMEAIMDAFMPKKVIPFRVPGPTPVYLDIELGLPAGASLKASANGQTRVIYESEYEFYTVMDYDSETGITTDRDQFVRINDTRVESQQNDIVVEAELFLKPQITARLYRVVGPYAYLKPYVRGEVEIPSREIRDDLFIGVTGGVGIEVSEPIFLGQLVSFDSGNLFDWHTSFDLDGRGEQPLGPLQVGQNVQNQVTVDRVGAEGFVRLNLKEHLEDGFLRYELVRATQTGLMVPSETFYMDGEIFYYPLPNSTEETFTVRIFGDGGNFEDVEIAIHITEEVRAQVSQDRFGMTTNSVRVANGTPGEFRDQVPGYNMGRGQVGVAQHFLSLEECVAEIEVEVDPENRGRRFDFVGSQDCQSAVTIARRWLNQLYGSVLEAPSDGSSNAVASIQQDILFGGLIPARTERNSNELTQITEITSPVNGARFSYFNLMDFRQYAAATSGAIPCQPTITVTALDNNNFMGVQIRTTGCEDFIPTRRISPNFPTPWSNQETAIDWSMREEDNSMNERIRTWAFAKSNIDDSFGRGEFELNDSLYLMVPFDPSFNTIQLADIREILRIPYEETSNGMTSMYRNQIPFSGKVIKLDLSLSRQRRNIVWEIDANPVNIADLPEYQEAHNDVDEDPKTGNH